MKTSSAKASSKSMSGNTATIGADIKPLSIASLNTLGEPDPGNITKQDLL